MTTIVFDVAQFRTAFPEFSDITAFPDATLQMNWDTSTCYISDLDAGILTGNCRRRAINLMTAHVTKISNNTTLGKTTNFKHSASVDKISVSVTPPPASDQYSWWLNTTPYGSQLEALLSSNIAGGLYVGGRREKSAFRKVGGSF